MSESSAAEPGPRFWPAFAATWFLGSVGVAGLLLLFPLAPHGDGHVPGLPAVALLQPLFFVTLAAAAGAATAPKLGLVSALASWMSGVPVPPRWRRNAAAIGAGSVAFGVLIVLIDEASRPLWLPEGARLPLLAEAWTPATLLTSLLYGGVSEEVMIRWGVMSTIIWVLYRLRSRRPVGRFEAWTAIVLAAIIFGAGHLQLAAAMAPLEPLFVARTVTLNAAAAILFGWLYWRRSLEMAILSHMSFHVGLALYALGTRALL